MPQFTIGFHPSNYWDPERLRIARIKGTLRQNLLLEEADGGAVSGMPELLRASSLPEPILALAHSMEPAFLSGEQLSDFLDDETEIARVYHTRTVRCEVTSVRARKQDENILIRIVDEEQGEYALERGVFDAPLTMRELVRLIDTARCTGTGGEHGAALREAGIFLGEIEYRHTHLQHAPTDLLDFLAASSVYYPELASWYRHALNKWVKYILDGKAATTDSAFLLAMQDKAG